MGKEAWADQLAEKSWVFRFFLDSIYLDDLSSTQLPKHKFCAVWDTTIFWDKAGWYYTRPVRAQSPSPVVSGGQVEGHLRYLWPGVPACSEFCVATIMLEIWG